MQISLADAVNNLDRGMYPFSDANRLKIRGSANRCAKIPAYNCPLEMIPVDTGLFVQKWQHNVANRETPEGFKSYNQFKAWHSNVKSLMDHASGAQQHRAALRALHDEWSELHNALESTIDRRSGTGIQTAHLVSLRVLQAVAREAGTQPNGLTASLIVQWLETVSGVGRKNAIRKSVRLLDQLHDVASFTATHLLPPKIGTLPKVARHRVTPTFPLSVSGPVESWLDELAQGQRYQGLASSHRRNPLSAETIKALRDQLGWYFSCLVQLGKLDLNGSPDITELITLPNILAAFDAEVGGRFPWKPLGVKTNAKNMGTVFRFARTFHPALVEAQREFFRQGYFDGHTSMTDVNEDFCRRLVRSPQRMASFLSLASSLYDEAAAMIGRFDTLRVPEQIRAVRLATAAATAAVLTFLPLRAGTLINLKVYGDQANIVFPPNRREVNFSVPREMMKNKKPITTTIQKRAKVDPRSILEWWLKDARAHAMARVQAPNPELLLGGLGYHVIAEAWKMATAERGIYMTLHQCRHAIASILLNQPGVDVDCIAALLADSPTTVVRAYAFFDRDKAFARGQAGLEAVNKALSRGGSL